MTILIPHVLASFPKSDTSLQSPAFIKQRSLTRISIKILASRPKGTGQALKKTFINADQKEGLGSVAQNTLPSSMLEPMFQDIQPVSRIFPAYVHVTFRQDMELLFITEKG